MSKTRGLFAGCALVVVSACQCGKTTVQATYGDLAVSSSTDETLTRELDVDFGSVVVGSITATSIHVHNRGSATLIIKGLDGASSALVAIGSADSTAPFLVEDLRGMTVEPGESLSLELVYRPTAGTADAATLTLSADNTEAGQGVATVTLHGTPVVLNCDVPPTLDFGVVAIGASAERSFTLTNATVLPADVTVSSPASSSSDARAFDFSAGSGAGTTTLAAAQSKQVSLTFSPTEARHYVARLPVRAHERCPEVQVALLGEAVPALVSWSPTSLDFGTVRLTNRATQTVTFENFTLADVVVSQLRTGSAEFRAVDAAGQELTTFTIPARGRSGLTLEFAPASAGLRRASMGFSMSLSGLSQGAIPLRGNGGGPDLQVTPATVNLGAIAYFPGATSPQFASRRLTVSNVGTLPNPPAVDGNLLLGTLGATGVRGPPYWELRPSNATTAPGEFSVRFASTPYDPNVGLVARAGQSSLDLEVELTPTSLGSKAAELVLFSNDPDSPEVVVPLTGDAISLPSCLYSLTPTTLDFGAMLPGLTQQLSFTLTNLGTASGAQCLVSQVGLTSTSDPAYSVPAGPIVTRTLNPGASMQVVVQLAPTGATPTVPVPLDGAVELFISSATTPHRLVTLQALLGAPCVTVTASASFGNVNATCASATQPIIVTNTCGWPVVLTSATITNAAGQSAGGPACPGTASCPEFTMSGPALPPGGVTLAPAARHTLTVAYAPIDVGADTGVLSVAVDLGGVVRTTTVALTGTGLGGGCTCFNLATSPPVFPASTSGLPYDNLGNSVVGWTGVPTAQGAGLWTTSGSELDAVGYHNFIPVVANDFVMDADIKIGSWIADWQFSLWDQSYTVGYKVSLGPSNGDTPYFGLMKVFNDPARNVSDRPYGDDLAIFCHGSGTCNASTTEPAVGDLADVQTTSGGYPPSGTWFHWRFTKTGGTISMQVDSLPPVTWTSACLNHPWRLVFGSWADVSVKNVTIH